MVAIRQQYSQVTKNTRRGHTNSRRFITVHQTGNRSRGANAAAHANLQSSGNVRVAAWHATVDDREAVESFPRTTVCWHAGDGEKGPGNNTSVGIEVCINADGDYRQAMANAAAYVAHVARAEGVPLGRIVQHHHWTGKACPEDVRAGRDGITWERFLSMVAAELNHTPPPAPAAPSTTSPASTVKESDMMPKLDLRNAEKTPVRGAAVKQLQGLLLAAGYGPVGLTVNGRPDGVAAAATKAFVGSFQVARGLKRDWVVGPLTWAQLLGL